MVAATATTDELAAVTALIERALRAPPGCAFYELLPAMCALIFLDHHGVAGPLRLTGPKSVQAYTALMRTWQWRYLGVAIGFDVRGRLRHGQHRLCAAALAGFTLETPITFGRR
jgi:hypothetical protein